MTCVWLGMRGKRLVAPGRYISKMFSTPGEAARDPWLELVDGEAGRPGCRAGPQADWTRYPSFIFSCQSCFVYRASSAVSTGLFFTTLDKLRRIRLEIWTTKCELCVLAHAAVNRNLIHTVKGKKKTVQLTVNRHCNLLAWTWPVRAVWKAFRCLTFQLSI